MPWHALAVHAIHHFGATAPRLLTRTLQSWWKLSDEKCAEMQPPFFSRRHALYLIK